MLESTPELCHMRGSQYRRTPLHCMCALSGTTVLLMPNSHPEITKQDPEGPGSKGRGEGGIHTACWSYPSLS